MAEDMYSCALAALAALLPAGSSSAEGAFLRAHSAASGPSLRDAVDRALQSGDAGTPLIKLAETLQLRAVEVLAVTLAAAVETDLMCGRAIAHLQSPVGGSRPTLGLLAAAFAELEPERNVIECLLTGRAVACGLLHLLNENAPAAERAVAVPAPLCLALRGQDASWAGTSLGLEGIPETPLPPSVLAESKRQARGLSSGAQRVLVLHGSSVAELKAAAQAIARPPWEAGRCSSRWSVL